jgi:hypothetical protein
MCRRISIRAELPGFRYTDVARTGGQAASDTRHPATGAHTISALGFFAIATLESNWGWEVILGARSFYRVLQKPPKVLKLKPSLQL